MSEILDVLDIEDQDFARQLIRERAEDARARLEKIPSHARA